MFELAEDGNKDAHKVWNQFGENLGLMSSHLINILDPAAIVYGGGISKSFKFFKNTLTHQLIKHCPSYTYNNIFIKPSSDQLKSIHIGASLLAINNNK